MPLLVTSPKHSFVNFNDQINDFILPAYNSIATAFQVIVNPESQIPLNGVFSLRIADPANNIVFTSTKATITNLYAWGRLMGITDADFPILLPQAGPLNGIYNTKEELFAKLKGSYAIPIGNDFNFLQACGLDNLPDVSFVFTSRFNTKTATLRYYKGVQQVTIPEDGYFNLMPEISECFKYVLTYGSGSSQFKVFSNMFKVVMDNTYLTKITYSGNEDAFGFHYPFDTVFNQVWLPAYLQKPKYSETRKVYKKSTGSYKLQSAVIEKEWELLTDYMPKSIHERVVVMLSHDNISFTNTEVNGSVTKKDEYDIDWQERLEYAQAKCKVLQPFEGRNSNCEKRISC